MMICSVKYFLAFVLESNKELKRKKMKLLRYGPKGYEKPALVDDEGRLRDISTVVSDVDGETLQPESLAKLAALDINDLPVVTGNPRVGACVANVGKFICIGLNYADHAAEVGVKIPEEPLIFAKCTSAIAGPNDDILIPPGSTKTDWEVELGVVIGKGGKHITEANAVTHVAGFCVVNDVSERDYQKHRSGQWVKGKSYDSFGPIGPYLVTTDEVDDAQQLSLWLEVDEKRYQNGNTKTMVYKVPYLISYLSQFFSLQPGDIIATGTPPGVGHGCKPSPVYLQAGQTVRLGIEGLGEQEHHTVQVS